jgi:hypothetical protein
MQSVPITTDVTSSNLDQGEVYNIQRGKQKEEFEDTKEINRRVKIPKR